VNHALLASALVMGLLGSGHCVVMCGGIVGAACTALPVDRRTRPLASLPLVLAFNAGRIGSYAAAGAVAGLAGATLSTQTSLGALVGLKLLASALMVAVGLHVAGLARALRWAERAGAPVWRRLAPVARRLVPVRSTAQALALGSLWGWMPCGLVYAALTAAVTTGDTVGGAATMAAFGLGTLPTLVAMGSAAAAVARLARARGPRLACGAAIAAFGLAQIALAGRALAAPAHSIPACCAGHATVARR
jgi:sulfite exporter TauE/SafE